MYLLIEVLILFCGDFFQGVFLYYLIMYDYPVKCISLSDCFDLEPLFAETILFILGR